MGPGTRDVCRWDPGTPKCLCGTWDAGPASETRDPKIFKWEPGLLIFYSFDRLFYSSGRRGEKKDLVSTSSKIINLNICYVLRCKKVSRHHDFVVF